MSVKLFAIGCSVMIFAFVVELIRREKMTFKYALTWLVVSAAVLTFAVFNGVLDRLAHWAGFVLTSNFIFFLLLVFGVLFSLLLTIYANEQNKRTEMLTQALAILEYRLRNLESAAGIQPKDPPKK